MNKIAFLFSVGAFIISLMNMALIFDMQESILENVIDRLPNFIDIEIVE